MNGRKLVFADFDQTITPFDTLLPFARYLLRRTGRAHRYPLVLFLYLCFRAGLVDDRAFRTRMCRLLVAGRTTRMVGEIAADFHAQNSARMLNPATWDHLARELGPTGRLVILSTNFDFIIEPLRKHCPDLEIHATRVAEDSGRYVGALREHVGSSADKLKAWDSIVAASPGGESVGFGDSRIDHDFLGRCNQAWIVTYPRRHGLKLLRYACDRCLGRGTGITESGEVAIRPFRP